MLLQTTRWRGVGEYRAIRHDGSGCSYSRGNQRQLVSVPVGRSRARSECFRRR
jgi:hypothetical protein